MKAKHLQILPTILLACILFPSCLNGFRRNDSKNLATGETIINCLKTKDVDAMYDLFSEQTKQETPFLKEDIKKFYALYEGNITSYKKTGMTADANKEGRDKSFEYFQQMSSGVFLPERYIDKR